MRGRDRIRTLSGIRKLAAVEGNLKYDLWIIAAGRGTRMGNITVPKCLVEIDGKSNLENTLQLIGHKFRRLFVVVAKEMEEMVRETMFDWHVAFDVTNVEIIGIESGGGDGKAVLEAFEKVTSDGYDVTHNSVILWGDAHLRSADIVDEMFLKFETTRRLPLIIPAVLEHRPYVAINTSLESRTSNMQAAMSADFIKYGEVRDEGWHDQSIFGVEWPAIINALSTMRQVSMKRDDEGNVKFTTQSGELTFLNAVHYLFNVGNPAYVYETKFPLMGYNTQKEVEKIKQSIKKEAT